MGESIRGIVGHSSMRRVFVQVVRLLLRNAGLPNSGPPFPHSLFSSLRTKPFLRTPDRPRPCRPIFITVLGYV